jgi:hypothetical protein
VPVPHSGLAIAEHLVRQTSEHTALTRASAASETFKTGVLNLPTYEDANVHLAQPAQ